MKFLSKSVWRLWFEKRESEVDSVAESKAAESMEVEVVEAVEVEDVGVEMLGVDLFWRACSSGEKTS